MKKRHLRFAFSALTAANVIAAVMSANALAAPCCGGASALPQLITGDDRAQVSASLSQGQVIGDAPLGGIPVFRSDSDSEVTQTVRLDGAYLLTDRVQLGLGVPLVRRYRSVGSSIASSASGLGDLSLSAAYEALPEWSYSPWKPRGFTFIQVIAPTGPSIYDAREPQLVDARGRGFWSIAGGVVLIKSWGNWDALASIEGHRSISRTIQGLDGDTTSLSPGWGGSALIGIGYSPLAGDVRLGVGVSPVYEGPIEVAGAVSSRSGSQLVWNSSFQIGYMFAAEWSGSLVYSDQTLLGPAHNVTLSRTWALNLQHRWGL